MKLAKRHGNQHPDAQKALMYALSLAPQWFKAEMHKTAQAMNLVPEPAGYLEDGTPMYRLEDLAKSHGISVAEAEVRLERMMKMRTELGISNDGIVQDPVFTSWRQ